MKHLGPNILIKLQLYLKHLFNMFTATLKTVRQTNGE